MLHLLNGDSTAETFKHAGLHGDVLVWREALIDGPAPCELSRGEWLSARARHLAEAYDLSEDFCIKDLSDQDEMLRCAASFTLTETGNEVVSGKKDYVKLNGVDLWLGGVHLQGEKSPWRWDQEKRQICTMD